jgi:predicted ATPase with chaperone activity
MITGQRSQRRELRRVYCDHFVLIGAMNPCPCGWYGDPVKECTCSNSMVSRYQKRISGPLLDRIDIHMDVPRVEYEKLSDERMGEPSILFLTSRNRRHPGARGSGAGAATAAL